MSNRSFYSAPLTAFLNEELATILGRITPNHTQNITHQQTQVWAAEIKVLKDQLGQLLENDGYIFFEFMIPRMGRRADVVITYGGIVFVIEFKFGAESYHAADVRQAHDYALDLKNFHTDSHDKIIIPILIATLAPVNSSDIVLTEDRVANPVLMNAECIGEFIKTATRKYREIIFNAQEWSNSAYRPTPTIVEAARALYANHDVSDILKTEAGEKNLGDTSVQILNLISEARRHNKKIICFVTGVPGAGKTLVGLDIANKHASHSDDEYSVFLSGNGPLVKVLQEALAVDRYKQGGLRKDEARRQTSQFIQNIHRFRDDALETANPPAERVAIFDEAQRAWDRDQTSKFMQRKRGRLDFDESEPEFLMSIMDRHIDWAVIVALIGGGQEINVGEAGMPGWFSALENKYLHWDAYFSKNLFNGDYVANGISSEKLGGYKVIDSLHLSTSMRSFRAEKLSDFVHYLVAGNSRKAAEIHKGIEADYPIFICRDLIRAKRWLNKQVRGTESAGLLASSNGIRLKADGIYVKNVIEPEQWFLNPPDDIRSSNFLEDVATEFDIQGLELDWTLVAWDADFRFGDEEFECWRFRGTRWEHRNSVVSQQYLQNAYRVLLTRARQGMIIYLPKGCAADGTRLPSFYDKTFNYLQRCGLKCIDQV